MIAHELLPSLMAVSDERIPQPEPGWDWGSPQRYRQQVLIDAAGGVHESGVGFRFPDGSILAFDGTLGGRGWYVPDADEVAARRAGVRPNEMGLFAHREVEFGGGQLSLTDQIEAAGGAFVEFSYPRLRGWGGVARVVCYDRGEGPTAVLCLPKAGPDWLAEEYFYFRMTEGEARAVDWIERYDDARSLIV